MKIKIKLFLFFIISFVIIYYLNERIMSYDMRFYSGKDNGYIVRLESICILSTLFFVLLGSRRWFINSIIGFIIGFLASVISVIITLILFSQFKYEGIIMHIISYVIFVTIFYYVETISLKKKLLFLLPSVFRNKQ